MARAYIRASTVKEYVKALTNGEFRVAGDVAESLDNVIELMIQRAVQKARADKRKTVQPRDFT
jgi:histone H3/H4